MYDIPNGLCSLQPAPGPNNTPDNDDTDEDPAKPVS